MAGIVKARLFTGTATARATDGRIEGAGVTSGASVGGICDGFGDAEGGSGGFGDTEAGFGDPCGITALWVESVIYEAIPISVLSKLPRVTRKWVSELGGQLVTLRSGAPLAEGDYAVNVRPAGQSSLTRCFGGVSGRGNVVARNEDGTSLSFVFPRTTATGACDVVVTLPNGFTVEMAAALQVVPYSIRSGRTQLESLLPGNLAIRLDPPTFAA